jgi:hypothetical protein
VEKVGAEQAIEKGPREVIADEASLLAVTGKRMAVGRQAVHARTETCTALFRLTRGSTAL